MKYYHVFAQRITTPCDPEEAYQGTWGGMLLAHKLHSLYAGGYTNIKLAETHPYVSDGLSFVGRLESVGVYEDRLLRIVESTLILEGEEKIPVFREYWRNVSIASLATFYGTPKITDKWVLDHTEWLYGTEI